MKIEYYFVVAAIIHGVLLLGALCFSSGGNRVANRLLALLVALMTWSLWNLYSYSLGLAAYWRLFDYGNWVTVFFWGPVMYFYVGYVSGEVRFDRKKIGQHCMVGMLMFLLQLLSHYGQATGLLSQEHIDRFNTISLLIFYVQLGLYLFVCIQLLIRYNLKIKQEYSNIDSINLAWLQKVVTIFAVLHFVDMTFTVPAVIKAQENPWLTGLMLAESVAIFSIGYFSLLKVDVLLAPSKPKYDNSSMSDSASVELLNRLKVVMDNDEPYLQNNLTLPQLAKLIGVSSHLTSQVINEHCGKNFYDFVNEYRVKAATELLLEKKSNNITQIAFDSGFNNRVSFNNAFKKYVGMTPSVYRRQNSS